LDPPSVCRRSCAQWTEGAYTLVLLNRFYVVDPALATISLREGVQIHPAEPGIELLAVHYLLNASDIGASGEWVGLHDIGGDSRFFVSHPPDFRRLLPLFSEAPGSVVRGAEVLGGSREDAGDLAVSVRVLPRVPIAFVYWAATDEFSASMSVLFDRTVEAHLPLDVLSAAVGHAIGALVTESGKATGQHL